MPSKLNPKSALTAVKERLIPGDALMVTYRSILLGLPGIDPVHRTRAVWGRERLAWLGCNELLEVHFSQVRVAEMLRI